MFELFPALLRRRSNNTQMKTDCFVAAVLLGATVLNLCIAAETRKVTLPEAMPAADLVVVQPQRDDTMLLNPGKGWVQYLWR